MTRGSAAAMRSFHVCWAAVWLNADCCGGGGGDFLFFKRFGLCARSASTRVGGRVCAFTPQPRTGALKPSQAASSPPPPPPCRPSTAATALQDTLTDIYTLVLSVRSSPTCNTTRPAITVAPLPTTQLTASDGPNCHPPLTALVFQLPLPPTTSIPQASRFLCFLTMSQTLGMGKLYNIIIG